MPTDFDSPFKELINFVNSNWPIRVREAVDYSTKGYYNAGVFQITSENAKFALKRHVEIPYSNFSFLENVFDHLKKKNFRSYPELLRTFSNQICALDRAGTPNSLTAWFEGESLNESKSVDFTEKVKDAAKVLASFHKALEDFPPEYVTVVDWKMSELWVPELVERYERVKSTLSTNKVFKSFEVDAELQILLQRCPLLIESIRDPRGLDETESKLRHSIIHCDIGLGHFLFDRNGRCCLIDFDRMRYGRRIEDIASLIAIIVFTIEDRINEILDAYSAINPITDYELLLLPFFIQYVVIRRLFWLLNETMENEDKVRAWLSERPISLGEEITRGNRILEIQQIFTR